MSADLLAARDPRAQARVNAGDGEIERNHAQRHEKILDERLACDPSRLGVCAVNTFEQLRSGDCCDDERLTGVASPERLQVELPTLRRDEQRRVDHLSHGDRGTRGCPRVIVSTMSRKPASTGGPSTMAWMNDSTVD